MAEDGELYTSLIKGQAKPNTAFADRIVKTTAAVRGDR